MSKRANERDWHRLSEEITSGMLEWRNQHPTATLREMETELDTHLALLRARMLEDMALASAAADWSDSPAAEHPICPECGQPLQHRGLQTRTLQTNGAQDLHLERQYGTCPSCGTGLFPPR